MRAPLSAPAAAATAAGRTLPSWTAPLLVFVAAALVYAVHLDRPPHPDELYQIIPAEGLLATGEPRIADGLYARALAQTWIIAGSLRLVGHSLAAARLSSLLGVAGTTALLFLWLRRNAGPAAAWVGAVGFGLSPFAVSTAQFARIYGVQTFAFILVCLLTCAALAPPGPLRWTSGRWRTAPLRELGPRLVLLALAVPPLLLATHLQPTTLLGAAGLGSWAVGAVALPWLRDPEVPRGRKRLAVAAALVFALALLAALWAGGVLRPLWHTYRYTPLFDQKYRNRFWFYAEWLFLYYPLPFLLVVPLALLALAAWPRPASLAACVFAVGFALNSFGGMKGMRYLAYALPFLFALWGMGLAASWRMPAARWPALGERLAGYGRQLAVRLPPRLRTPRLVPGLVVLLALANPAWVKTAARLADVRLPGEEPVPDWAAARPALEPWLKRVPVMVTTEELGTLYFLGRFDVRFSPSKLGEIEARDRHEFASDPRTGRAVISTVGSLGLVFDCYPEGLFLLASRQWGHAHLFSPEVQAFVRDHGQPIPLPARGGVTAYGWAHPDGYRPPAACASLPPMPGPSARMPVR
jgi:hypothetical protein